MDSGLLTIREIVSSYPGLDRSILLKNAQSGKFAGRTRKAGGTWLVDVAHDSFLQWLQKHKKGAKEV